MADKKLIAFTLIECMLVFCIIGIIGAVAIPVLWNHTAAKIKNVQYYEAYRTLLEAAKKVVMESEGKGLRIDRDEAPFYANPCDKFTDIISILGKPTPEMTLKYCIDSEGKATSPPANDQCNECDYADGVKLDCNPKVCKDCMPANGGKCSDGEAPAYCVTNTEPLFRQYFNTCNETKSDDKCQFTFNGKTYNYSCDTKGKSRFDDTYNFDKDDANFTSLNGMRFFGLEEYPEEQQCSDDEWNAANNSWDNAKADAKGCRQYKNVYIDTDGIPKSPATGSKCSMCTAIASTTESEKEAKDHKDCYDCLKGQYGVYKFRLYNNGSVVPITDQMPDVDPNNLNNLAPGERSEYNERIRFMRYNLTYMQNGVKVEMPGLLFPTYNAARNYKITAVKDESFRVWANDGGVWQWWDRTITQPCKLDADFIQYNCEIIPMSPDARL